MERSGLSLADLEAGNGLLYQTCKIRCSQERWRRMSSDCESAWGPEADRRAKLLIYLTLEGYSWTLIHNLPALDSLGRAGPDFMPPHRRKYRGFGWCRMAATHPNGTPRDEFGSCSTA